MKLTSWAYVTCWLVLGFQPSDCKVHRLAGGKLPQSKEIVDRQQCVVWHASCKDHQSFVEYPEPVGSLLGGPHTDGKSTETTEAGPAPFMAALQRP